jgi:hypothetical protein
MNRTFWTLFLVVAALVAMTVPAPAQSMSTISKGVPLNASSDPITGFQALATPTITWSAASAAVRMPALPAGTIAVTCIASGAINYGDSTVVSTAAASGRGPQMALTDGTTVTFKVYPNTPQPDIWFVPTATGTTNLTVRFIAHVQK